MRPIGLLSATLPLHHTYLLVRDVLHVDIKETVYNRLHV
jgi:hypothetical protein